MTDFTPGPGNGQSQRPAGERIFQLTAVGIALFSLAHLWAFPIVITWDSYHYLHHTRVIFTPEFSTSYDFMRGPLYPVLLSGAMRAFGQSANALIAVNVAFHLGGTLLLGWLGRKLIGPKAGAAVILLAGLYPVAVGYSHAVLLQSGMFFFTALMLVNLFESGAVVWRAGILVLATGLAYTLAPQMLYLAYPVAVLFALKAVRREGDDVYGWRLPGWLRGKLRYPIRIALHALPIIVGIHLIALPWQRIAEQHGGDRRNAIFANGMMMQAIPSPDSAFVRSFRSDYVDAINWAGGDDNFPIVGMGHYPKFHQIGETMMHTMSPGNGGEIFRAVVKESPGRYAKSVIRSVIYLLGVPSVVSENMFILDPLYDADNYPAGVFYGGPEHLPAKPIAWLYKAKTPTSLQLVFAKVMRGSWNSYAVLVLFGGLATVGVLVLGLLQRRVDLLILSVLPLSFIGMFSVVGMTSDRYAYSVHALYFLNAVVLLFEAFPPLFRGRDTHMASGAT